MFVRFRDRAEAGQTLARKLSAYANRHDVLVLALPRGGVPVALEVARSLRAPLDVFLVRKLGLPGHQELAMGAIASGGVCVLNDDVVQALGVSLKMIQDVAAREQRELERRERLYRGDRPLPAIQGKTVILVDDGMATGASMRAAVTALRRHDPARIVVASPTAALSTCEELGEGADECICAMTPSPFKAVGLSYEDFLQVTDRDVRDLLERGKTEAAALPR